MKDWSDKARTWPTKPGVYVMKNNAGQILYVGKAKNLRSRLRSYFQNSRDISPKTQVLVRKIEDVECTITNNELDALLLECNLIKKHRPRYNIRLKDDKNFPYFVLDFTHPFPRFEISRRPNPSHKIRYFGPYGAGVNEISRFLLKTFQIRDCSDSKFSNRDRPCLNYEIGTCTAPCVDYVDQQSYGKQVQAAILFLKGRKRELLKSFKEEMWDASEKQDYERARAIRDRIAALLKITQKQDTILAHNQQDIDVIGSYREGETAQWVALHLRSGFLTGRRAFRVQVGIETDESLLRTFLEQFYIDSLIPDEIWIENDFPERTDLERLLSQQADKPVRVAVKRGKKSMRLLGMAQENAKLLFLDHGKKSEESGGESLQTILGLATIPIAVEGIDVSTFQGAAPVASLVHFEDGRPLKSRYRTYHPRTVEGQDDFKTIYETVYRRFTDPDNPPPDLLMIDGGRGQLAAAVKALQELQVATPVCSLAKGRTGSAFTRKEVKKTDERIFIPNRKNPIVLREGHSALRLLQQVRDEAHRFAIKAHRSRRGKQAMNSPLMEIRGIGEKTKEKLLKHFGNIEAIKNATPEELHTLGISDKVAATLLDQLRSHENDTSSD